MFVYLIINTVNRKMYVGRTKNSIQKRFKAHIKLSKIKGCSMLIARAIKKYGEGAFQVIQLDTSTTLNELVKKETEWKIKLNTMHPNGYNMILNEEKLDDDLQETLYFCRKKQGTKGKNKVNCTSKYVGVSMTDRGRWFASLWCQGKRYCKSLSSELEAAETYDKIALFLFGDGAKLNFPEKFEEYKKIDLRGFYETCITKYKREHKGVYKNRYGTYTVNVRRKKKVVYWSTHKKLEDAIDAYNKFIREEAEKNERNEDSL